MHKFFRGVARPELLPDDVHGTAIEKPWIAAVEGFAIGGHCQILLTMDYVLAANDAFMTLPARKEGIIPGAANLRLPRFTGDRIARQAIQYERKLVCDSPEGRLICDEIAPAADMDAALDKRHRRADQFRRGQRHLEPPRAAHRRGAARHIPDVFFRLRPRPGLLPFQPGADRQSRARVERA